MPPLERAVLIHRHRARSQPCLINAYLKQLTATVVTEPEGASRLRCRPLPGCPVTLLPPVTQHNSLQSLQQNPMVEADISRFKRVIGDGLRSRIDRRRVTEVTIAVDALNRKLELGRPNYVHIA